MKYRFVTFIIILFLFTNCSEDGIVEAPGNEITPLQTDITNQSLTELLNERIPGMIDNADIPGLQMAVIKNSNILWRGSYGVKNNDTGSLVDNQSLFQAASLGKVVFAYVVLKLVEEGLLDLDTPLIEYTTESYVVNNFNRGNPLDERINLITARMVLTHCTGFPNWRSNSAIEFIYNPGERFSYSGEGFVYLQLVVEYVKGELINEIADEYVFQPFRMNSSSYVWKDEMESNITNGHDITEHVRSIVRPYTANVAGSLLTTAEDYAKFMLALINRTGLTNEMFSSMLTFQIQTPVRWGDYSSTSEYISWGLGIGIQETELGKAFWHWGDNDVFKCFMIAYPEANIGLVYFTNSYNGLSIADELIKITIGAYNPAIDWLDY